jgi:hypothetical protein
MADSLPDDPITASFIGIIVAISGNVLISLALNCQKLAHRRLDEQRQQLLFYGSSSHTSSSTETPVNLSRTNSNVGFNVSSNGGTHDSHGEERRPLLGPNRGHSVLVTPHEYGTTQDHLPQTMKNKVLVSLAKLRPHSASKPPTRSALPDEVLSPVFERYPREISDVTEATEEDHSTDDDELDETPRAESDYLRSKLWCVHLYVTKLTTRSFAPSLRDKVDRVHSHEYRRVRQLPIVCVCTCICGSSSWYRWYSYVST